MNYLIPHRRSTLLVQEELPEVEEESGGLAEEEDKYDEEEDVRVACVSACWLSCLWKSERESESKSENKWKSESKSENKWTSESETECPLGTA